VPWRLALPGFAVIVILAAALRLPALDLRPMHADEAVHAAKLGRLLERGLYEYDPTEYHGPTLYYLTLVSARVQGAARYADLNEVTLRSVPAVAGVLLVALHVLLVPVVGFRAAAIAALFAAVSPAMVYYSRYYIQETLLAVFSFAALISICRYVQRAHAGWAIGAGASIGLMFATKETWILASGCMVAALLLVRALERWRPTPSSPAPWWPPGGRRRAAHVAAGALTAAGVSALFFSSFFTHPRGIVDSVTAYSTYVARAGQVSWHVHPWHYYLGLLLYSGSNGAPIWTEAAILGLAVVGGGSACARRNAGTGEGRLLRFLAAYAVLMAVCYSVIPYKTPWCVLGFLHAFILLAGVGGARLLALAATPLTRTLVAGCLTAAVAHLGWLAWAGSVRFASDPRNPYVYAHTGAGVFEIERRVGLLARAHPDGGRMPIEVISRQNLWPLPWYLRRFPAVRWETSPVNDGFHAPVILATPDMERALAEKLYEWRRPGERELYVPIFDAAVELRPQVEVRGYAAKSVWDKYQLTMERETAWQAAR
jgi:uncharacterized protein (TIGR03663 family)